MNIVISIAPFVNIFAHMCSESGRFGFGMEGSPSHLNCFVKNLSHLTVLSSVNMQLLNSSLRTNMSVQKASRFLVFSARVILAAFPYGERGD